VAEDNAKAVGTAAPSPVPFKFWFWSQVFDLLRANGRFALGWLFAAFCVYQSSVAIRAFAGQATFASVTLKMLASATVRATLALSVSGFSIGLYVRERKQHQETRKRLAKRITDLELRLDPKRTSSNLTPEGLTRKEDA